MLPKYILIISQYRNSIHCFVTPAKEEGYQNRAKRMIEELEDYKRSNEYIGPYAYGDFDDKWFTGICHRANVNDAGDIYFIPCANLNQLLNVQNDYCIQYYKMNRAYIRQAVTHDINKHHSYPKVFSIVNKHFELL